MRSESARWSDRFFDGDGADDESDEDEDNEYTREWRKAKARGEEGQRFGPATAKETDLKDVKVKKIVKDGKPLTASPKASVEDLRKGAIVASASSGAAAAASPVRQKMPPVAFVRDDQDDTDRGTKAAEVDPQILSLTGIGLRKSLEEQVRPGRPGTGKNGASDRGGGVAEKGRFGWREEDGKWRELMTR